MMSPEKAMTINTALSLKLTLTLFLSVFSEDVVRLISAKKEEPEWLLEFRLKAFRHWQTLEMPRWAHLTIPEIDYQAISYYAAPRTRDKAKEPGEVDPELLETFDKLGIPLAERNQLAGMAVDAVMDSVSVKTTHQRKTCVDGCYILFYLGGSEGLS